MPPRTILKIRRSSRLQTKNLLRGPLTKFTLFPELPTEIRAMIWSFVVEEERIVVLEAFFKVDGVAIRSRDESDKRSWISKEPGYEDALALKTPQPVLLHVCAESRAIALEVYTIRLDLNNTSSRSSLYLHPSDTLYFADNGLSLKPPLQLLTMILGLEQTKRIPHLMLPINGKVMELFIDQDSERASSNMHRLVLYFSGLKTLTFLSKGEDALPRPGRKLKTQAISGNRCLWCGMVADIRCLTAQNAPDIMKLFFDEMNELYHWSWNPPSVRLVKKLE